MSRGRAWELLAFMAVTLGAASSASSQPAPPASTARDVPRAESPSAVRPGDAPAGTARTDDVPPTSPAETSGETPRPDDALGSLAVGQRAEEALRYADAVEAYERTLSLAPTSRAARTARRRLDWIRERSDGAYDELRALEAARRRPQDAASLAAFEREAAQLRAGPVRREAYALLAHGWSQLGETARSEAAFVAWADDPTTPPDERLRAVGSRARMLAEHERLGEARDVLAGEGLEDADIGSEIASMGRAASGRPFALVLLVLSALVLLVSTRGRFADPRHLTVLARPGVWLLGAWLVGFPFVLATLYDPSTTDTFQKLGASVLALFVVALLAARALEGQPRWRRVSCAGAIFVAHLAMGYLVLLGSGTTLGIGT